MAATLFFVGCLLAPSQAPLGPGGGGQGSLRARDWVVSPHLGQGQELLYRGTYGEESLGGTVQFSRTYRIETRVFVLESTARGVDVALLTILKARDARGDQEAGPAAVRLEKAHVEPQGRVVAEPGRGLTVPLDGPPTCECGMVVEMPVGRVALGQGFETVEVGRPLQIWRVVGLEMVGGTSCLKLVGNQRSEDWDQPRLDRTAWQRTDTVWIAPRTGVAARVERAIERREAGRREPSARYKLRYELESSLQYPGQLFEDRKQEVEQAWVLGQSAQPLLAAPGRNGPQLSALLTKVNYHVDKVTPTPYREAVLQLRRQLEAARRGEGPVAVAAAIPAAVVAEVGQKAPDFVVSYITHAGPSFQLQRWLGRPIVLVFYNPASPTGPALLTFAQKLAVEQGTRAAVFGLAVAGEPDQIRKQWNELHLTFPVLSGSGLRRSYAIETTPKIVVLDLNGTVRGSFVGWGSETAREVEAELRQNLLRK